MLSMIDIHHLELKKGYSFNLFDFDEIHNWSYNLFTSDFFQIIKQSINLQSKRNLVFLYIFDAKLKKRKEKKCLDITFIFFSKVCLWVVT